MKYKNEILSFSKVQYQNGVLGIQVMCQEGPFATLSTNLGVKPSEGCFWLKSWSENQQLAEFMVSNGYVVLTGKVAQAGYADAYEAKLTEKGELFVF